MSEVVVDATRQNRWLHRSSHGFSRSIASISEPNICLGHFGPESVQCRVGDRFVLTTADVTVDQRGRR